MAERESDSGNGTLTSIRHWAPDDRPREKLLEKGPRSLSDAELMAILIRSGSTQQSALDLCRSILAHCNNDLSALARLTVPDLMRFKGIGDAKAISIVAALELGRRRKDTPMTKRPKVDSSATAYELMRGQLLDLPYEEFWVLLLDRGNAVIGQRLIGRGGVHGTVADPKVIFKHCLEVLACGVILFHNHPSGQLRPSESDIQLTRKLSAAGAHLDITVHDHIIIGGEGYYSFRDNGMF